MIARGAWHQFGDRSQKLVNEQLDHKLGVGVILSPRDLAFDNAAKYAADYIRKGAQLLFDPQFHVPEFSNKRLVTYPTDPIRASISTLGKMKPSDVRKLVNALAAVNQRLGATAVVAPAVVYDAGRPELHNLNRLLFDVGAEAAKLIDKPVIASVILSSPVLASQHELAKVLATATSMRADGWYLASDFETDRIPSSTQLVEAFGGACLTLAITDHPVIHAFAGPMSLLSMGVGATAVGIGHAQNLWQFSRTRFEPPAGGGGGGNAPPRYYSSNLHGTVIHPDETSQLGAQLTNVLSPTPFSANLTASGSIGVVKWSRWDANKHLVACLCKMVAGIANTCATAREAAVEARAQLRRAETIFEDIATARVPLRPESEHVHQKAWTEALTSLLVSRRSDYDYLELLSI